jgi:hypothetical protein
MIKPFPKHLKRINVKSQNIIFMDGKKNYQKYETNIKLQRDHKYNKEVNSYGTNKPSCVHASGTGHDI